MPIDELGNRADIVGDPNATVSRMNLGRLYESFFASSARDFHTRLSNQLGVKKASGVDNIADTLYQLGQQDVRNAWSHVLRFYKCFSEDMVRVFDGAVDYQEILSELAWVMDKGFYLHIPSDAQKENWQIMQELQNDELFRPHLGPITYIGTSGKKVKTLENIRIGSMYFILLEKIADDWSSVHSAKLQVHGVISQLTKHDKYSKPTRLQGVRGSGEAEVRILASYIGGYFVADSADRNNNPKTHRVITNAIMSSKTPTNIENAVDRNIHPFTNNKPLMHIKHLLACTGIKFDYEPYKKEY